MGLWCFNCSQVNRNFLSADIFVYTENNVLFLSHNMISVENLRKKIMDICEHAPMAVPMGKWKVVRQREHVATSLDSVPVIRAVAD
jgi:hypothetical protein